ncbi:GNAT family N-acetyltransferase [Rathayibacter sp. VKM Ac-2928]|nr:GNAT family N-acetyltransferase [Rathayibacter sp. VKM Ac-2928]
MSYRGDPNASRFLQHAPMQNGEYKEWHSERSEEWHLHKPGNRRFYGITELLSGELIGDAVLVRLPDGRQVEIGMFLNPRTAGLGYSMEAGSALLELVFNRLEFRRTVCKTNSANHGAIKAITRMGLSFEGHFQIRESVDNEWMDTFMYSISADQWKNSNIRAISRN